MTESTASNFFYFLAGALLPTIAYFLLQRSENEKNGVIEDTNSELDCDLYDDDDDDDNIATNESSALNPSSWGMRDAPYKVKSEMLYLLR